MRRHPMVEKEQDFVLKKVKRKAHWRWQRCGIGKIDKKRVRVRATTVTIRIARPRNYELPL